MKEPPMLLSIGGSNFSESINSLEELDEWVILYNDYRIPDYDSCNQKITLLHLLALKHTMNFNLIPKFRY